jgi:hypothetical protein
MAILVCPSCSCTARLKERFAGFSAILAAFAIQVACSGASRTGDAVSAAVRGVPSGAGVACVVNGRQVGPLSYAAHDVGKLGVPAPARADLEMLRKIEANVHSTKLRFVYVGEPHSELLIYNATSGPCSTIIPGYQVLNAPQCGAAWAPLEGSSAMPDCWNPPRPWIPGDGGKGSPRHWLDGTAS